MSNGLEHEYVPQMRHFQSLFQRYRDQPVRLSILQSHFGLVRVPPSDARPLTAETALQISEWLHANGDPHAFAWLASELDMGAGDGLVYYLRAHDTLETALVEFSRLASLLFPDGRMSWSSDGRQVRIVFAPVTQATRLGAHLRYEAILVWFVRVLNYIVGAELPILRVEVMSHEGADPAVLGAFIGLQPTLGANECVLEYPAEVLQIHLPGASLIMRKAMRPVFDQRLTIHQTDNGIVRRIADWMGKLDDLSNVNLDSAASALAVGASTLRRQLAEEGCKFSALFAAKRARQAMDAIIGSDEKMESLAQRLGYADRNTFERAFRERFEITPALCRRAACELLSARRFGVWSSPQNWPRHSPKLVHLRNLLAGGHSDPDTCLASMALDPVLQLRVLAYLADPTQGARESCVVDSDLLATLSPRTLLMLVDACLPGTANARTLPPERIECIWRRGALASRAVRLMAEQLAPEEAPVLALVAFFHNLGELVIPGESCGIVEGIDCTWLLLASWHVPPELLRRLRARHNPQNAGAQMLALAIQWAEATESEETPDQRTSIETRIGKTLARDVRAELASILEADDLSTRH